MAISYVDKNHAATSSNDTSLDITIPAHSVGDLILLWMTSDGGSTTLTCSGTETWSYYSVTHTGGRDISCRLAYAVATGTSSFTATIASTSSESIQGICLILSGTDTSTIFGQGVSNNDANDSPQVQQASGVTTGSWGVAALVVDGDDMQAPDTGYPSNTTGVYARLDSGSGPHAHGSGVAYDTTATSEEAYAWGTLGASEAWVMDIHEILEASGVVDVNVTPGADALALTGQTPLLAHGHTLPAGADALVLTGQAPTAAGDALANAGNDALTLTGQIAGVATDATVAANADAIALTGQVPALVIDHVLAATADTLTLTGQAPAVQTGTSVAVTAQAGAVTLTGQAPALVVDQALAAAADAVTLTGLVPTLAIDGISTAGLGSVTVSGQAPQVTVTSVGNVNVTADADALTLTGLAPTIAIDGVITADADALILTGLAPTVLTTGAVNVNVTADFDALILTGQAPSIVLDAVLSAQSDALALTGQAPTVDTSTVGDVNVTAGTDALTLGGQAPTIFTNARVVLTPASGSLSLTGYGPDLINDQSLVVDSGTLTLTGLVAGIFAQQSRPSLTSSSTYSLDVDIAQRSLDVDVMRR